MKFGYFDDASKEYVITTPKTPYPWINYLGTQDFFGLISNTAGGYCFYKDARLRRLTRYRYNNVPVDMGGRYFYVKDENDYWSLSWSPVKKDLENYECRHGMGYTKISGTRNGIHSEVLFFVPMDFNGEIHKVTLKNDGDQEKTIDLFSYIEFCMWNAYDDMTNFQRNFSTGEVEIEGSAIYHKTEYRERRNHFAFYTVNHPIDGYDTDRESFIGLYNGMGEPQAVLRGKASNSEAHGWSPIASHYIKLTLNPGEEKVLTFVLGYVENEEDQKWEAPGVINKTNAREMMDRFDTTEKVDAAFDELKQYWASVLSNYQVKSGDEKLDRMVNIWNQYQCTVTLNLSRSASYFESGIGRGIGFRDSNQDILGVVHQVPERSRQRILDLAATQLEDGGAYHQYQPLTKKGNDEVGGNFNDDPLWLILSTAAYVKETGDFSILDEQVAFDNDETRKAPLMEHLKKSFDHVIDNLGPHGLPLIGRADWNDCLNLNCFSEEPDQSFQTTTNKEGGTAESVLIAGMFAFIGPEYVKLCKLRGSEEEAERAQKHIDKMVDTIIEHGYDGGWFLRAYDYYGNKIGSKDNEEGKIFIETQGFCAMAGVGMEKGLPKQALDSTDKYLDTQYGIRLQWPAYSKYYLNLGEISSYPPGYKENAGIFCHNNPWIMIGETVIGRGDKAFEYYSKIAPSYLEDISEVHRMEPYVYSQMIAGSDAPTHGEAKNSWLTGTAAWNFVAVSQWILGIQPDYDGLVIDPCIPADWDGFQAVRKFRGSTYEIQVKNESQSSKGVKKLKVDGVEYHGNKVPVFNDNKVHQVEITL